MSEAKDTQPESLGEFLYICSFSFSLFLSLYPNKKISNDEMYLRRILVFLFNLCLIAYLLQFIREVFFLGLIGFNLTAIAVRRGLLFFVSL